MPRRARASMIADTVDREGGIFESAMHPDDSVSGSAFTTEDNVDAPCPKERRRVTQAAQRRAEVLGPAGTLPRSRHCYDRGRIAEDQRLLPVHELHSAMISRKQATGSPSIMPSIAALRFASQARAKVPVGQKAVSQTAARSAKSAMVAGLIGCRTVNANASLGTARPPSGRNSTYPSPTTTP